MIPPVRSALALLVAGVVGAAAAGGHPDHAATTVRPRAGATEAAEIIPAGSINVGNSFANGTGNGLGFGYGLYATGITDYWATSSGRPTTQNLVIFVFPGTASVAQSISVTVTSPTGATVYHYGFARRRIDTEGAWFTVAATGSYARVGTYAVTVRADGTVIGRIPLVFSAPAR